MKVDRPVDVLDVAQESASMSSLWQSWAIARRLKPRHSESHAPGRLAEVSKRNFSIRIYDSGAQSCSGIECNG